MPVWEESLVGVAGGWRIEIKVLKAFAAINNRWI
jgi:hypothetical protein